MGRLLVLAVMLALVACQLHGTHYVTLDINGCPKQEQGAK